MILKQVIKYENANALEATWVEVVTPETVVPASIDASTGAVIPEEVVPAVENVVRCHAYDDRQMDMLRADVGDEMTPEIETLIADVLAKQEPIADPAVPPISVTPWKIRKALNQLGLRESVEKSVAESDDYDLKDAWQYAQEFVEDDPLVIKLCAAIGKTDTERHALFVLAETL